ncbi:MAG: hypothetical protein BGO67_09885 [Alphaproteobacteria bacterium 41-28]|nr:MAG: hypothetical protein BGO67_09885 [Alphaproteobacteria bacterium 41-28]
MPSYLDHLDWDKLKSFYVVALNESFTKASLQMNLTQSALSRQISTIEYQLKSQLFIRGADKLSLTSKGKILFDAVSKMIEQIKIARSLIEEEDSNPRGKLTIATTHAFANIWLLEHVSDFIHLYPNIDLSITLEDNLDHLYSKHYDVVIGVSAPSSFHFVHEKLFTRPIGLYASEEYLKKFGTPKVLNDLDHHRLISFGDRIDHPYNIVDWFLRAGCELGKIRKPFLEINSFYGKIKLAETGVGIITLANNNPAIKKLGLIRVLPEIDGPIVETFYNFSKSLENSKRVRVLKDFLMRIFADEI